MNGMDRVDERVRQSLQKDYENLMERTEAALTTAYPPGLKFRKMYIEKPEDINAVWVITQTVFSSASYEHLTWHPHGALYSCHVHYKKLDKQGRPNGREWVVTTTQFDAGMRAIKE